MEWVKKLASETLIYGISSIGGKALSFLLSLFYMRLLETTSFGVYSYFYAYVGFISAIMVHRMDTAYFHYNQKKESKSSYYEAFSSVFQVSILIAAIMMIAAPNIAQWIGYPESTLIIRLFALLLLFDAVSDIPFAKLRLENKAKRFATIKIAEIAITVALNVILLIGVPYFLSGNTSVTSNKLGDFAILLIVLANLGGSFSKLLFLWRDIRDIPWASIWKTSDLRTQMVRYAAPLTIATLAGIGNETADRILLNYQLIGDEVTREFQLGVYSGCYKIAIIISLFIQAYRYASEPFFFKQIGQIDQKTKYAQTTLLFTGIASFGFLVLCIGLDYWILLTPEAYWEGKWIIPIVGMAFVFLGLFTNVSIWYKVNENTIVGAVIGILGFIITIVGNLVFIPKVGYWASAWTTLACYFFMFILSSLWGQRIFPIRYPWFQIIGLLTLSVLLSGIYWSVEQSISLGTWSRALLQLATIGIFSGLTILISRKGLQKSVQ